MELKAAAINDLSGLGQCSLEADITVLGTLGIHVCPVPTAVLSSQTGYPGYYCADIPDGIERFTAHWKTLGLKLDGILTGFLNNAAQACSVNAFLDAFQTDDTLVLVDPVMADGGHVYANYTPELGSEMRKLIRRADIITPNISELMLVAGGSERKLLTNQKCLLTEILRRAAALAGQNRQTVIVTGIPGSAAAAGMKTSDVSPGWHICSGENDDNVPDEKGENIVRNDSEAAVFLERDGDRFIGNLVVTPESADIYLFPREGGSFSGTGDLFAAAVMGGRLNGYGWDDIIPAAGKFIGAGVRDAASEYADCNDGIPYEQHLSMLASLIRR